MPVLILLQLETYLSAPTKANNRPFLNSGYLFGDRSHNAWNFFCRFWYVGWPFKQSTHFLALLVCVRGKPAGLGNLASEQVGHEDLILAGWIGIGKYIGALLGLGTEAKDIIDYKDCRSCGRWPGDILWVVSIQEINDRETDRVNGALDERTGFQAIIVNVFTFLAIVFYYRLGNVAACLAK